MHTDGMAIGKWLSAAGVLLSVTALAIAFEMDHGAMTIIMLAPPMVAAGVAMAVWAVRGVGLRSSFAGHSLAPDIAAAVPQAREAVVAFDRPATIALVTSRKDASAPAPEPPPLCRSCGAQLTHIFLDLGTQAAMDDIASPAEGTKALPAWPLRLAKCDDCHLVQIAAIGSQPGCHRTRSEPAPGFPDIDGIISGLRLTGASRVVQIASGNGALLRDFHTRGPKVLGIEPYAALARTAIETGVATRVCHFDVFSARKLLKDGQGADLLIARNVLSQIPHLDSFADAVRILLKPNGVFLVEFPHLLGLIEETRFDAIHHAQRAYFSLIALERLFAAHGLRVLHATRPSGNAQLRVYACRTESTLLQTADVGQMLKREVDAGLDRLETFEKFADRSRAVMTRLRGFVLDIKAQGKTIVAYGESPRGNALLAYCGIDATSVAYVADPDAAKHGFALPGSGIPIAAPDRIRASRPDFLLVLPGWPVHEVVHQYRYIQAWGGRFGCLALC